MHVSLMNRTINLIEQINDKAITTLGDDALVNQGNYFTNQFTKYVTKIITFRTIQYRSC